MPSIPVSKIIRAAFVRFPFVNALSLCLLLSERSAREVEPPVPIKHIYVQIAMSIGLGSGMSMGVRPHECGLLYCIQLLHFMGLFIFYSDHLGYKKWINAEVLYRLIGTCCIYLWFSTAKRQSGLLPKKTISILRRASQLGLLIFASLLSQSLITISAHRQLFLQSVWASFPFYVNLIPYLLALVHLLAGFFIFCNFSMRQSMKLFAMSLLAHAFFIDSSFTYWKECCGIDRWLRVRMLLDLINVALGLLYL